MQRKQDFRKGHMLFGAPMPARDKCERIQKGAFLTGDAPGNRARLDKELEHFAGAIEARVQYRPPPNWPSIGLNRPRWSSSCKF